jgi:hypothetical protein
MAIKPYHFRRWLFAYAAIAASRGGDSRFRN